MNAKDAAWAARNETHKCYIALITLLDSRDGWATMEVKEKGIKLIKALTAHAVAEARAPLVEALEKVEWPEIYHRTAMIGRLCPGCGQWKGDDPDWDYHATLCPLAAALAAKETP